MVGTSVGSTAEDGGRSTSCVAGFPGPQFSAASQISHSICTTPSPGPSNHAALTGMVMTVGVGAFGIAASPVGAFATFPVFTSHVDDA